MNYLKKLNEKRAEAQGKMEDLIKGAETEERALTSEEQTLFDELEKEIKAIADSITKYNASRKLTEEGKEEGAEDKKEDTEVKEEEKRALDETKVFENFVRNIIEERADINMTIGANGAVIPTTIANKIISTVYDISPILAKSTKYNVKGKLEVPYYSETSTNKTNMAYATEFTDLESNVGSFATIELNGYLAGALNKISNSLINNSQFDVVNEVVRLMAEAIARFIEGELINGTVGKVEGLSGGTKLVITSASATAITGDEVIKLKDKVKQAFQKNAIFIMNSTTLTALRLLKDSNGRYLLQDDVSSEFGYKLLGKDVFVSDNMAEIGAGNTAIYYGDMSGLATKFTQEMEIQILRERYAPQHATGIVAWVDFDAKVENAQAVAKLVMKSA